MDALRPARPAFLRRHASPDEADLERQASAPSARPSPMSSVLRRFADLPRPAVPSLRGRLGPRLAGRRRGDGASETVSPKTAQFAPATPAPAPAPVPPAHTHRRNQSSSSSRRRFDGADPAELRLAEMVEDGRERRERRRQRRPSAAAGAADADAKTPATFLFCFPRIRSHRMRAQLLRCFVSGSILALMLAVYLSLVVTDNITNSEFSVVLLLILLATAAFFCHSLVRVCMLAVHPPTPEEEERYRQRRAVSAGSGFTGSGPFGPEVYVPGGYAVPRRPIRVVLARDEEAAGMEDVAAKSQPPAYGLWRESVRVDPNRIYWQRNEAPMDTISEAPPPPRTAGGASVRPPSYASEDGVRYVVDAQPRSIAPTTDVPLPTHPAEAGRRGQPSER